MEYSYVEYDRRFFQNMSDIANQIRLNCANGWQVHSIAHVSGLKDGNDFTSILYYKP